MINNKKKFYGGSGLLLVFSIILLIMFSPIFEGKNTLECLDSLYNSISKDSAYFIPKVKKEVDKFIGNPLDTTLTMKDEEQAQQVAQLFMANGSSVNISGNKLEITGDLGKILSGCLADADTLYKSSGTRPVLFNWWNASKAMEEELKKQKKFDEVKAVALVREKAVEVSYNYEGINPQNISSKIGIVFISLTFYIIYTLLYGFAIMFIFEGLGFEFES